MRFRSTRFPVALVALLAAAALRPLTSTAGSPAHTIATSQTLDFRVAVVVTRTSGGQAPTAKASMQVYGRTLGKWRRLATMQLPETYFWKVITAPGAVCRLEISTAQGTGSQPRVTVSLLETPSIGCGPARSVRLPIR